VTRCKAGGAMEHDGKQRPASTPEDFRLLFQILDMLQNRGHEYLYTHTNTCEHTHAHTYLCTKCTLTCAHAHAGNVCEAASCLMHACIHGKSGTHRHTTAYTYACAYMHAHLCAPAH